MALFSLARAFCALALLFATSSAFAATSTGPNGCTAFDVHWNLLAFNFNGKDYNAGALPSTAVQDITQTLNRPPFDVRTSSPLCYLSQFTNAIYVLNADSSSLATVYIYDATANSWSKQLTSGGPSSYDPSVFAAILDHDTNVFYALSGPQLLSLDMSLLKAGTGATLPWTLVQTPNLAPGVGAGDGGSGVIAYQPVMALAQNHIHFLGVPSLPAGDAVIFVIHFSFLQPTPQSYGSFPTEHGKTASFFKDAGVQTQFAYIPDDGSATYVIDVVSNTTRSFPAPSVNDEFAQYSASTTALVQLSSAGQVSWLAYDPTSEDASTGSWQTVSSIPVATNTPATAGAASPSSSGSSSSAGNGTTPGVAANGTSSGVANSSSTTSAAASSSPWQSIRGLSVLGVSLALGALGLGL